MPLCGPQCRWLAAMQSGEAFVWVKHIEAAGAVKESVARLLRLNPRFEDSFAGLELLQAVLNYVQAPL